MHLGGAEISLIGLLQSIDPQKVDVDLFVYSHEGELMKLIPKHVNLLPEIESYSMFERPMVELLKKRQWGVLGARLWSKCMVQRYKKCVNPSKECAAAMGYLGKYVSKVVPDINPIVEYDLAISFLTPHNFVLDHVRAKKKVCWIHTDYSRIVIDADLELPVWNGYDYIASISNEVTKTFLTVFPELSSKIMEIENIMSPSFVEIRAAEEDVSRQFTGKINLLSVGRFCEAKNYDNVPNITKLLIDMGCDVKWYIIGFGGDEVLIRQKIIEAGMQEHVIILGKKTNPYPYIKACDIYVQPSRYEGKSVTVREAQMLCKPVVVTNYPTASSQINDGVDGIIVPMDNDGCAKGLYNFINDLEMQNKIVDHLKFHDYGNESEVDKIYRLI